MKKVILLSLGVLVLGAVLLNRVASRNYDAVFPGDFRDALKSNSALEQVGPAGNSGAVIPEPAPPRVSGLDKNAGGGQASWNIPVMFLQLNSSAFRGDTGEDTKRNVSDFVGQLGKTMVGYTDHSDFLTVKVLMDRDFNFFDRIFNRSRIESALKDLPGVDVVVYQRLLIGQSWLVMFKKSMYRDRVDKILAPLAARHGLKVQYPNSIETLDSGLLEAQIPADSANPAAYAKQLCLRFPDKLKFVDQVCCACEKK
ncbi:MAG: hypothetical protein A2X28_03120 [Elusimicrobia bacterium GWA2_56_46]|nr:MAG: hypothetical protein A2X28_03120 [Elusimicrobia bacterium GWA2_56_46]OGR54028.1 MAG: hypothetical protein A2X39_05075 [Elusimicrobia bacterium GWC2_56_31]HBB68223.1 hypothetical protein [Elusimicrobiota bacterium]HBW23615.1 hypothetical protein [Elusimicrobiota bacterium]